MPGNVAVFFTSYPMMNNYRDLCLASSRRVGKRLCVEPRSAEEVPELLDQFFSLGARGGGVLTGVCGGKLAEGIDYKGEALKGVAVVGLPLAAYDEIQREINSYGRVIRAESERGVLLFCDRRFKDDDLGGVNRFLPSWVRDELIVVDAREGRELIRERIKGWGGENKAVDDPGGGSEIIPDGGSKAGPHKRRGARRGSKRDLRELARSLGLGGHSPRGNAAPRGLAILPACSSLSALNILISNRRATSAVLATRKTPFNGSLHSGQSHWPTSTSTKSIFLWFNLLPASEMATPMASSSVLTSLTSQAPSSKTLKLGIAYLDGRCIISTFSALKMASVQAIADEWIGLWNFQQRSGLQISYFFIIPL